MCRVRISCVVLLCLVFVCYVVSVFSLSENDTWALEPWWFPYSHSLSYTVVKTPTMTFRGRLLQWTAFLMFPLVRWLLRRLEPLLMSGNCTVQPLLDTRQDPFVNEYEAIFRYFDFSVLPVPRRGPKRNTLEVYAKVFLIKVHQKLHSSSELREFFCDHPQLIPLVGFFPVYNTRTGALDVKKTVVSARHLRRKLQIIDNQHLKLLLKQTLDQLHAQDLLKGTAIADTTEILAWVKENNLKQRVDKRFEKTRPIKGFPECSLGAKPIPGEKHKNGKPKIRYFWGAKQAAFVEPTAYGTAFLYEEVFTANTADVKTALPTLKPLVEQWAYRLKTFIADAAYDAFEIYQYVYAKESPLNPREPAAAYIALNSRGHKRLNHHFSEHGNLFCEANLEMTNGGRWFDKHKGYHRQKFTCPLVNQKTKHKCKTCPINHPAFQKNGCYRYLNLDDQEQLRFKIHRDSKEYKNTFKQRTCVEQAFSYIKEHYDIEVPKVRNLNSVKNISTIAAILNNVQILEKATSQNTQKPGEEHPQNLGVLRI